MRASWPITLAALCCFVSLSLVAAECPNGCSGNGDCMAKDMCNCYKSFQGNDCADRTCLFGRAHVDTPKGDINMDQSRRTSGWILTNSQQQPAGTYEYFSPDASNDEAHFYMECSNKGICDRTTGLCQCFDGYEGNGCQRTTCPGKCNGHGTCESIRELGVKARGTLFGPEGAAGAVVYDLWDGNSTYGCRCDPWFHGPDCNRRSCKVGVDPLFLSAGTPTYETFVVIASPTTTAGGWIRLRLFDYHGESYITSKIPITDDATGTVTTTADAIADAIKAIPNQTFRTVKCQTQGLAGSTFLGFKATRADATGATVVCQFTDNPGKMRLPEIASSGVVTTAMVTTTFQQGWDYEWFTEVTTDIVAVTGTTGTTLKTTAAATGAALLAATAAAPLLIKVGPHILLVAGNTATDTFTLAYDFSFTPGSGWPVFVAPTGLITTLAPGTVTSKGTTAVGANFIKVSADPSTDFPVGSTIFFYNAFYTVQKIFNDGTDYNIWLDKPFGGTSTNGGAAPDAAKIHKVVIDQTVLKTKAYKYVSECSGRGLCGYDTGICTCFKGYTNDNCNQQNILAL